MNAQIETFATTVDALVQEFDTTIELAAWQVATEQMLRNGKAGLFSVLEQNYNRAQTMTFLENYRRAVAKYESDK